MEIEEIDVSETPTWSETRRQRKTRLRRTRAIRKNELKQQRKQLKEDGLRPQDGPTAHERHKDAALNRTRATTRLDLSGYFVDGIGKTKEVRLSRKDKEAAKKAEEAQAAYVLEGVNSSGLTSFWPLRDIVTAVPEPRDEVIDLISTPGTLPEFSNEEVPALHQHFCGALHGVSCEQLQKEHDEAVAVENMTLEDFEKEFEESRRTSLARASRS